MKIAVQPVCLSAPLSLDLGLDLVLELALTLILSDEKLLCCHRVWSTAVGKVGAMERRWGSDSVALEGPRW